ncbi:hypothetical protein KGM_200880 [Danaus plexippus plexippus]|uniref:Uncharacterized protein n=1 Tax=Danaus plexippus plexippus TaxID=278856 RepID=A0A212FN29_DANPL|nr:hypothetical protein KGM_200880 [Danaus plexippus plexippus]
MILRAGYYVVVQLSVTEEYEVTSLVCRSGRIGRKTRSVQHSSSVETTMTGTSETSAKETTETSQTAPSTMSCVPTVTNINTGTDVIAAPHPPCRHRPRYFR